MLIPLLGSSEPVCSPRGSSVLGLPLTVMLVVGVRMRMVVVVGMVVVVTMTWW